MIGVVVGAVAGFVRGRIGEFLLEDGAGAIELIGFVLEVVMGPPAAVASPLVLVAADKPLFRKVDRHVVVDEDRALDRSDGAEGPTAPAAALVLDGGDAVVFAPVPAVREGLCW